MSLNQEERIAVVTYRLEKSVRTMEEARFNLAGKFWGLIANRLYYAAYYAVSALLIANGHTAKTHESIVRILGLQFIRTGILPKEYGHLYNKLFAQRLTGDYNDHYNLEECDVLPYVESTERMIADVSKLALESLNED